MDKKNLLRQNYNKKKNNSIKWVVGSLAAIAVIGGSVIVPILGSGNSKGTYSWDNIVSVFNQNLQKWVDDSADLGTKFNYKKKSTENIKNIFADKFKNFILEQYFNTTSIGSADFSIDLNPILSKETFDPTLPENYGTLPIRIYSNNSTNQKIYYIKGFAFSNSEFYRIFKSEFIKQNEINITGILPTFPFKKDTEFQIPSYIDDGVKEIKVVGIGREAMPNLELKSLKIPNTITRIEDYAFKGSKVGIFDFPESLSFLGSNPFVDNTTNYILNFNNNSKFKLVDNQFLIDGETNKIITFLPVTKTFNIPNSVLQIGDSAAKNLAISKITFTNDSNITIINNSAFEGITELSSFSLPSSVQEIGQSAFRRSSIQNFSIPKDDSNQSSQLIRIGDFAFADCKNLIGELIDSKNLFYIPNSTTNVEGINLFQNSPLIDVVSLSFSNFIVKNYNNQFQNIITQTSNPNGTILSARVDEGLQSGTIINNEKFKEIFGNQVPSSFLDAKDQSNAGDEFVVKKNIVLPQIDKNKTFDNLTIPEFIYWQEPNQNPTIYRITEIPTSAFESNKKIKNITLPKSIVEIGNTAFKASSLSTIHFSPGSNIKSIGDEAFSTTNLQEIDLSLTLSTENNTTFGSGVFANNSKLNKVIWNSKYKNIPNKMFLNASSLTSFNFVDNGIQVVGESAFKGAGLTSVTFNDSISTIGVAAFENNKKLTTLTFDNNTYLANILDDTFNGCSLLETINSWPTQLVSIGNNAFNGIAIQNLTNLPNSLNVIGNNAFSNNSNLLKVVLPINVSTLGDSVFENDTSLNDLIIPESVISVGNNVLANCSSLKQVYISYEQYYGPYSGSVKLKLETGKLPTTHIYYQQIISDNSDFEFTKDETNQTVSIKKYKGLDSNVSVPEFVRFSDNPNISYHVVGIGSSAFKDATSIINLSLPNSIREIGNNAFENTTKLSQLDLTQTSVTTIPESAFKGSGVLNVDFSNNITTIASSAFENASKLSIINLSNITTIGNSAFKNASSLFNIISFSNGLTTINDSVFENTPSLQLSSIPNTITSIGNSAFANSKFSVDELVIPNSITSIGDSAFAGLNYVKSIRFQENNTALTTIPSNAFSGLTNMTNFDISDTKITTLSDFSLANNQKLVSIKLARTINTLGNSVFEGCSELVNLSLPASINTIGSAIAKDCPKMKFVILTPAQLLNQDISDKLNNNKGTSTYTLVSRVGTPGSEISTENFIVQIIDGQGYISGYTDKNATSINIPEFVQSSFSDAVLPIVGINPSTFANMTSLQTITLSSNLTYIGDNAFQSAINLRTVYTRVDNSLENIGNNAFENCSNLTSIGSAPNLKAIGHSAFKSTKLNNLELILKSTNLQKIGNSAFESTLISGKISFNVWKKLQVIGSRVFANTQVTEIDMSDSADNINLMDYTFANMKSLTSFKFNTKLTVIPIGFLSDCSKLTSIQWPNDISVISQLAFANTGINSLPPASSFSKLRVIESFAFKNTNITNIDLTGANLIESIRENAFANIPNLVSVIIPNASNQFIILESNVFSNNPKLKNIILPSTIKTISANAFNNLPELEQVLIPSNVSYISPNAFNNLPKLQKIGIQMNQNESLVDLKTFLSTTLQDKFVYIVKENEQIQGTKLFDVQFNGNNATLVSYIGNASKIYVPAYVVNDSGSWFKVTSIAQTVFQTKKDLIQEVVFDNNIPNVNATSLFQDLLNLVSVTLSNEQDLYMSMFKNTPKLKTVIIKNKNITAVPSLCFFQSGIEDLDLSAFNKIISLNLYCFEQSQITNLKLPTSINIVKQRAFAHANKLISLELVVENDITLEASAFEDTTNLVQFNIVSKNWKTSSITLNNYVFRRTFLSSLDLGSFQTVKLVGELIFANSYNLRSIWLPNATESNPLWHDNVIYGSAYKATIYYPSNFMTYDDAKRIFNITDNDLSQFFDLKSYNNVQ